MSRLTKKQKARLREYERHAAEMDLLVETIELGGTFDDMARVYSPGPVRRPDGTDAGHANLLTIHGRLYEITDGLTGVAADVAQCLRQFASDLQAAANAIEASNAERSGLRAG